LFVMFMTILSCAIFCKESESKMTQSKEKSSMPAQRRLKNK
jgi:hypothetical protein